MNHRTNFIKIRAYLTHGLHPMRVNGSGVKFNQPFRERLYDIEEQFRELIILPLNDKIGLHNWAIKFIEYPTQEPTFFADVYVDNKDDFLTVVGVIQDNITDIKFSYYYKGDISTYIDN